MCFNNSGVRCAFCFDALWSKNMISNQTTTGFFFFFFLYSPEFIEVRVYIHKHAQAFGKFAMQYYVLLLVYSMY